MRNLQPTPDEARSARIPTPAQRWAMLALLSVEVVAVALVVFARIG